MSTLSIPVPTISTGPEHMTDTEAAEHYLREMRDRTEMLQAGSGVTALVNRLLDDVLDAMEALNASTDTPTPDPDLPGDESFRPSGPTVEREIPVRCAACPPLGRCEVCGGPRSEMVIAMTISPEEQRAVHHNQLRYAELQKARLGLPNRYAESRYR